MTQIIKPLRSGQITIPASFRQRLGINTDSLLQISLQEGELHIKPVKVADESSDSAWLEKLYDHFSQVRKEARGYSQKEIDESIGKAVKASRTSHG